MTDVCLYFSFFLRKRFSLDSRLVFFYVTFHKAKAELGYVPRTSFEDGIAKTVAWYRDEYWPQYGLNASAAAAANSVDRNGTGATAGDRSDSEKFDALPTEELELWPGGVERRLRSLSSNTSGHGGGGGLYSEDDEGDESTTDNEGNGGGGGASGAGNVGKAAEQRRRRRLLPKKLPRALPPAATALLASLHLDVRTSAQVMPSTCIRSALLYLTVS